MARACVEQCRIETERKLAQRMVDGRRSETQLMTEMLKA